MGIGGQEFRKDLVRGDVCKEKDLSLRKEKRERVVEKRHSSWQGSIVSFFGKREGKSFTEGKKGGKANRWKKERDGRTKWKKNFAWRKRETL